MRASVRLHEVRNYHKLWKTVQGDTRYADWFGNKHRVYLPMIGEQPVNKTISEIQLLVSKTLSENGYSLKDYSAGVATKAENAKNEIKVGKILQRINPELKNKFDSDVTREGVKLSGLKVVISKHPLDIMTMSTGRGWSSCMHLQTGANKRYVAEDVKEGTLIAYLIKDNDLNIKNPVARVLIKPFVNGEDTVLVIENRVYGTDRKGFKETIEEWLSKFQFERKGIYNLNKSLYNDGKQSVILGLGKSYVIVQQGGNSKFIVVANSSNNKYAIMNKGGDLIVKDEYDYITADYNITSVSFFRVTKRNNSGQNLHGGIFLNKNSGEIVNTIDTIYHNLQIVSDKYFINCDKKGFYGIIDVDNNVILENKYSNIQKAGYSKNILFANLNNVISIFDIEKKEILFEFKPTNGRYINNISHPDFKRTIFSITSSNSSYTTEQKILNEKGEVIIESCNGVSFLDENHLNVAKNITPSGGGRVHAIYNIEQNKFVTEFKYTAFNKIRVGLNELSKIFYKTSKIVDKKKVEIFLDSNGNEVFSNGWDFCNNIAGTTLFIVGKSVGGFKKAELFDLSKGEIVISEDRNYTWFDTHSVQKSKFLMTLRNHKYGLIDKNTFEEVIPPIYDLVKIYTTDTLFKLNNLWGYINNKNEIVEASFKTVIELKTFIREERIKIREEKKILKEASKNKAKIKEAV